MKSSLQRMGGGLAMTRRRSGVGSSGPRLHFSGSDELPEDTAIGTEVGDVSMIGAALDDVWEYEILVDDPGDDKWELEVDNALTTEAGDNLLTEAGDVLAQE